MNNLTIQYIFVGIILLSALLYVVYRFTSMRKDKKTSACAGCDMARICENKNKKKGSPYSSDPN